MKKAQIRIFHDGESPAWDTKITHIGTGEEFYVKRLSLIIDPSDQKSPVRCMLEHYKPVLDIAANADILQICPCCRRPLEETDEDKTRL